MFKRIEATVPSLSDIYRKHNMNIMFKHQDKLHIVITPTLWVHIMSHFMNGKHLMTVVPVQTKVVYMIFAYNDKHDNTQIIDVINFINVCKNLRVCELRATQSHVVLCVSTLHVPHILYKEMLDFIDEVVEAYVNKCTFSTSVWNNSYDVIDIKRIHEGPLLYKGMYESADPLKVVITKLKPISTLDKDDPRYCEKHWMFLHHKMHTYATKEDYYIKTHLHNTFKHFYTFHPLSE